MQIIPVIDLRDGAAVHAIAGERHRYAPVRREGMRDGDPLSLAAFYGARKPAAIYLADLDSIAGNSAQIKIWEAISQVAACPLWIDCGLRDETSLEPYLDFQDRSPQVHQLILASETLTNSEFVTRLASVVGAGSIILSLDRKEQVPLTKTAVDERALLLAAANAGIQKVIALDLATVGVGRAVEMLESWRPLLTAFPSFEWFLGGGVRNAQDLHTAEEFGFRGVLSATAILKSSL
jgi:phosphoribosylformimino-5-aminoimidazole carboxamide ribotide isomerase